MKLKRFRFKSAPSARFEIRPVYSRLESETRWSLVDVRPFFFGFFRIEERVAEFVSAERALAVLEHLRSPKGVYLR